MPLLSHFIMSESYWLVLFMMNYSWQTQILNCFSCSEGDTLVFLTLCQESQHQGNHPAVTDKLQ